MDVAVSFSRVSRVMYQLAIFPLMQPEITTNSSTKMLTAVKTLLTAVDSFTPNARRPSQGKHTGGGGKVFRVSFLIPITSC